MDVDFKILNNEIIIDQLTQYAGGIKDKLQKTITASLLNIEAQAKSNCPVDLGSVKQSITAEAFTDEIGGRVVCLENLDPPLSAYLEFGTGAYVQIPPGLEEYAMTFYKNGKGHMKARPFLFPAFDAELDNLNQNLKDCL